MGSGTGSSFSGGSTASSMDPAFFLGVVGGVSWVFVGLVFLAIGIELPVPDVVLACIALVLFIVTNVRGVQITGRLQNGFMFFFWGVAVIWFLTMIPEVSLPTFVTTPDFLGSMDAFGFIAAVAMISVVLA